MPSNIVKVSVVMSVYNESLEWLRTSIDSILQQTFKNFDFIIVCDNPSYDEGISLLKKYAKQDSRIKIIYNEENIGLTKSLNKGIQIAEGKYIARMDADDISLPTRLQKQIFFMEANPEIVASGTGAYFMKGDNLRLSHRPTSPLILKSLSVFESPIYHPSAIFKREIDEKAIYYEENFKFSQDYALWLSLMKKYKVSNIDEPLIKYRISESQISTANHGNQQEYAIKNQLKAVELLELPFSYDDCAVLRDLTRTPGNERSLNDVRNFIIKFIKCIKGRTDVDVNSVLNYLLLLYANYLPKSNNIFCATYHQARMFIIAKRVNIYSMLSLYSKYFVKWNLRK